MRQIKIISLRARVGVAGGGGGANFHSERGKANWLHESAPRRGLFPAGEVLLNRNIQALSNVA